MCFELGLHQQETYESTFFSSNPERYRATVSFWSIYVLDRRWSFGTGLPFVIEEQDIDPNLLKPVSFLSRAKRNQLIGKVIALSI
jgi:hypothetical protein